MNPFYSFTKRALDLSVAIILTLLLLPLISIVWIFVIATMGKPAVFAQERAGYRGRPFTIYKFRTMKNSVDSKGNPLPDEERLTRAGKFLRATSLDELPQLFNVVRGDMSLVGPRPLYVKYIPRYSKHQSRRLEVPPGITGWAQVNGRNAIDWQTKLDLDVWYVENRSFLLDLKILWLTLRKTVGRKGINQDNRATVDEFMGNT